MTSIILANLSDIAQKPHPVFGIPLGLGLFVLLIFFLFKPIGSSKDYPDISNKKDLDIDKNKGSLSGDTSWQKPKEVRNKERRRKLKRESRCPICSHKFSPTDIECPFCKNKIKRNQEETREEKTN